MTISITWLVGTLVFASSILSAQGRWQDEDLATSIQEAESVQDAVELVQNALERKGYEVVLTVDHAAAAARVNLELRPTQLILARPPAYVERYLLRRSQTAGIDLPVKILIFEDEQGFIESRSNSSRYLADRHGIVPRDFALRNLDRITNSLFDFDNGLVSETSELSVADTAEKLQQTIGMAGVFSIPLVLDYGEFSHRSKPVLIVFGNPNAGTPLMQSTQEIALDLPQKFLIWEDRDGVVYITYNDPFFIAKRHNLTGHDMRLENISNALANFVAAGARK